MDEKTKKEILEKMAHVPDDEVLRDLETTEKEADAYLKISRGHRTLAALPDGEGTKKREHAFKTDAYMRKFDEARELYENIRLVAVARGLNEDDRV